MGKMLDTLNTYLQTATQAELQEIYNSLKSWIPIERSAEERAREHYGVFINGRCISYDDQAERSYILGATEQEAITKRELIDNACEWIEERKHPVLASDTDDTIVGYDVSAIDLLEWLKAK